MTLHSPHPHSWFNDSEWIHALGLTPMPAGGSLVIGSVKGVPAWHTPPWALEVGGLESGDLDTWRQVLEEASIGLVVCDLPPAMDCDWGAPWHVQQRHTRWLTCDDSGQFPPLPKHRAKQARKALTKGITLESTSEVNTLVSLHQMARDRKSIPSDAQALERLFGWMVQSPHQTSYIARDGDGIPVASATFLHNAGRTVYAFGGQRRSPISGLATVLLIEQGIRDAAAIGNRIFDFGGSSDPGVDRFYAEFDAEKVPRQRAVRMAWWARPWLRLMRPDLF